MASLVLIVACIAIGLALLGVLALVLFGASSRTGTWTRRGPRT